MTMMMTLIQFELKQCAKQKRNIIIFIVIPICFYIIAMIQATALPLKDFEQFRRNYLIHMAILSAISYVLITLPQELALERKMGWLKRLVNTEVTYLHYFISKICKTLMLSAFAILCLCITGVIFGIHMTMLQWGMAFVMILIGTLVLYPFAYGLASIQKLSRVTAYSNLIYVLLIILGGLWIPLDQLPKIVQIMAQWLTIMHIQNVVIFYLNTGEILWLSVVKIIIYCIILLIIIRLFIRKVGDFS